MPLGPTNTSQGPRVPARPPPHQVAAQPPLASAQSLQGSSPDLQGSGQGLLGFTQALQALRGSNRASGGSNQALGGSNQALGGSNQALGGSNRALGGSNQALQASDQASQAPDRRVQVLDTASQAPNRASLPSEQYARGVAQMIQGGGQEIARIQAQLMGQRMRGAQALTIPQHLNTPEEIEPMEITGSSPNSRDHFSGDTDSGQSPASTTDVGSDSDKVPGVNRGRPVDLSTFPSIPSSLHLGSAGDLNCLRGPHSTANMSDWELLQCSQQYLQSLASDAAQGAASANPHPQVPSVSFTRLPPCPTGYDTDPDEEAPPNCIYQR